MLFHDAEAEDQRNKIFPGTKGHIVCEFTFYDGLSGHGNLAQCAQHARKQHYEHEHRTGHVETRARAPSQIAPQCLYYAEKQEDPKLITKLGNYELTQRIWDSQTGMKKKNKPIGSKLNSKYIQKY